jgi:phage major head subunit gpT-like protein
MPALTPSFLFDFESNMQGITENEYARFSANLWWSKFMKTRPSGSRQEIIAWLLSTAKIEDLEKFGGKVPFEDLVATYTAFESKYAGAGLKLRRAQLEDLDGNGLELASKWSGDIGAYMAYWPQKQLVSLVKNGHLSTNKSYDAVAFFSASHPVNPFNDSYGTFANIFTGAASGSYPGACPIDDSVPLDTAIINLSKIVAYVRSIKMPNGEDPRFLRPVSLVVPPRMQARAVQLTNAKFIAQAASSGGGSADVEALIASFGFVQPVVADELAGFESDTTFFVGCEEVNSTQLGAFVYVDRDAFKITYYTGSGGGTGIDAILDRADELEWHSKGRNVAGYGHPYAFHKCKGS